jgi:hypothetical protein
VSAERLEGRELPVAGLALEHPLGRRGGRVRGRHAGAVVVVLVVAREEHQEARDVGAVGQPDHLLGLLA